jgi:hypothetical protein
MSTIKVDKITGRTGSAGASSPLQFNGDTLTLGTINSGVSLASATLTGTTTLTGDLVPSTPLSHRNMIINGAMTVAQRSTSTVAQADLSNEGYATLDRWHLQFASGCPGTVTTSRDTESPDGFNTSIKLDCTGAGTPVDTTNDYIRLWQKIEGQDLQRLAFGTSSAKSITLSWYMKSTTYTDPISIHFLAYGSPANEYYNVTVTPTTSWARYSVTVPGSTSLTFANDNTAGLNIGFTVAGPATPQHTQASNSTSWSTTTSNAVTDIGNLVSSTSNILYLTGVQLELGSNATPFEHRSYGDELARCSRYYQKYGGDAATSGLSVTMMNTTAFTTRISFHTEMRDVPTAAFIGAGINSSGGVVTSTTWSAYHNGSWKGCILSSLNSMTKTSTRVEASTNDACLAGGASVFYGGSATAMTFLSEL